MQNITINSPQKVFINYNTNLYESQVVKETLDFHGELQKLHKENKKHLADFFSRRELNSKAERVKNCGNILTFKHYKDIGVTRLDNASLCRERLCLNCNQVNSREKAFFLVRATEDMSNLKHITLSVKNCKGIFLRNTIETMKKALKYFLRSQHIKNYYQSYEITHNKKEDTYHPHIHLLVCDDNFTLKARELNKKWAEAFNRFAGSNYSWLSCKIKQVEDKKVGCFELSKYVTKPQDFNSKTIPVFDRELKGLHLHQANGIFKERLKDEKTLQEKKSKEEEEYYNSFDYELIRYIFNGDNYIKCE
jgi:plasmid rolling circle replication initiator protein Rep